MQLGDGRWERVSERRTEDGGYVGIWTDITAVKLAEQRLLAAIDSMADGFALFDAEDRLVCYNKGFMDDSTSRNFPDPRGHTFEEIIRAFAYNDVTAVSALLDRETWIRQRVERHRNPTDEPFEQQTTDGKWYRVFERRTADGGCLGIWTDISALKNAEARVRDAIESINEGFALLDADLRFVIVNSNFVGMYPVSGKLAVPGARLEDMLRHGAEHGEYPGVETPRQVNEFVALWMERFTSGDRYLGEGEMPDGSWFLVSHHPTATGGYVSIRADITTQKKREAALSAAMSDLEVKTLELGVLADELEQARRAADLANLGKSQFLANMAHELRTPLNAINGFSEIILKEMFGPMPERYKGYVEFIQQGGGHLLSLINDILDLSKIEAGKMDVHVEAVPTEQVVVPGDGVAAQGGGGAQAYAALRYRRRLPDTSCRSARGTPDPAQPDVQRGEVHAALRHHHAVRAARRRHRHLDRGRRHRHRHERRGDRQGAGALWAGGVRSLQEAQGHRSRPAAGEVPGGVARRIDAGGERAGQGNDGDCLPALGQGSAARFELGPLEIATICGKIGLSTSRSTAF